jgi:hypothetical protein
MKHKVWELDKEDLERFASCAMSETIKVLVGYDIIDLNKAIEFKKTHTMLMLTPDSVSDTLQNNLFGKNTTNKNAKLCIVSV